MASEVKFEQTVTYRLARVTTAYRNALERHLAGAGLHGGHVFVLIELWRKDGVRQVDIASRLNLSAPTINKILKGLSEINLITTSRERDDARSSRVFLTEKGRKRAMLIRTASDIEHKLGAFAKRLGAHRRPPAKLVHLEN